MGKGHSKNKKNGGAAGAAISGNLSEPPPPAATDPRLPLNARQKFSITKSWKGIARAMEPTGVDMFVRLFKDNTELLNLFEKFQELKSQESQRESMELAEHANVVMSTLDESISSLDNVDYFIDYLKQVGKMHRRVPGFKKEYFWRIEKPFLSAVQETLGDRYTDNMANIYELTIKYILETVAQGYEEATESQQPAKSSAAS